MLTSFDSNAYSTHDLNNLHYGIGQVRQAGKNDVFNTRPLAALRKLLKGTM